MIPQHVCATCGEFLPHSCAALVEIMRLPCGRREIRITDREPEKQAALTTGEPVDAKEFRETAAAISDAPEGMEGRAQVLYMAGEADGFDRAAGRETGSRHDREPEHQAEAG